jgi:hypothetical protein
MFKVKHIGVCDAEAPGAGHHGSRKATAAAMLGGCFSYQAFV